MEREWSLLLASILINSYDVSVVSTLTGFAGRIVIIHDKKKELRTVLVGKEQNERSELKAFKDGTNWCAGDNMIVKKMSEYSMRIKIAGKIWRWSYSVQGYLQYG